MYTSKYYKGNDWFFSWLPDPTATDLYNGKLNPFIPSVSIYIKTKFKIGKVVHYYQLTTAKKVGEFNINSNPLQFYGPPGAEDTPSQIKWTKPYFDCGRSNKWVIGAVSPIVDVYPRHTEYRNVQAYRYIAVSVATVDFIMMDINQCENFNLGQDQTSTSQNYFAGTHKCKRTTRVSF